MDRHNRPSPEPTTLEAVGDQWHYAFVAVQAGDDDDDEGGVQIRPLRCRCITALPVKTRHQSLSTAQCIIA